MSTVSSHLRPSISLHHLCVSGTKTHTFRQSFLEGIHSVASLVHMNGDGPGCAKNENESVCTPPLLLSLPLKLEKRFQTDDLTSILMHTDACRLIPYHVITHQFQYHVLQCMLRTLVCYEQEANAGSEEF